MPQILEPASFWEMWNPFVIVITILLVVAYVALIGPLRNRFSDSEPVSTKQKVFFFTGITIIFLIKGTPIDYYASQYLFSLHMIQQSMMFFFIAPVMLLSIPTWALRSLIKSNLTQKILRVLTFPVLTIFWFSMLFTMYHFPSIYNLFADNQTLHNLAQGIIFIAAVQMWWSIISPIPEISSLSPLRKIFSIVASGVLTLPIAAMIIFTKTPMYDVYANAPQVFWFLSRMDDQQLAGVSMKLIQEICLATALANTFFKWYTRQKQADSVDLTDAPESLLIKFDRR